MFVTQHHLGYEVTERGEEKEMLVFVCSFNQLFIQNDGFIIANNKKILVIIVQGIV